MDDDTSAQKPTQFPFESWPWPTRTTVLSMSEYGRPRYEANCTLPFMSFSASHRAAWSAAENATKSFFSFLRDAMYQIHATTAAMSPSSIKHQNDQ